MGLRNEWRGARRRGRWLGVVAAVLLLAAAGYVLLRGAPDEEPLAGAPARERIPAVVDWVIDGDTVDVIVNGEERRIRLLNIDAPEEDHGGGGECLGDEATGFVIGLIPAGTAVELEYDERTHDQYGRDLAGIWVGEVLVNAEVARAGLALPVLFDGNDRFHAAVTAAVAEAEAAGVGLWAADVECAGLPMP